MRTGPGDQPLSCGDPGRPRSRIQAGHDPGHGAARSGRSFWIQGVAEAARPAQIGGANARNQLAVSALPVRAGRRWGSINRRGSMKGRPQMRLFSWANRLSGISALVTGAALALALGSGLPAAAAQPAALAGTAAAVPPNPAGELDCNGLSPIQHPVKSALPCIDPRGNWGGRFYENGHYIGHDEPSIRFVSGQPGSGSNVTFNEKLPVEPAALPTVRHPGHDVTHYLRAVGRALVLHGRVRPAVRAADTLHARVRRQRAVRLLPGCWRGLRRAAVLPTGLRALRRQHQLRQHALVLRAEHRQPGVHRATDRVQHLQPASAPSRSTSASCRPTACPPGRRARSSATSATFTPNRHTLLMNPGDKITVRMFNAKIPGGHALEARETDWSTGRAAS